MGMNRISYIAGRGGGAGSSMYGYSFETIMLIQPYFCVDPRDDDLNSMEDTCIHAITIFYI